MLSRALLCVQRYQHLQRLHWPIKQQYCLLLQLHINVWVLYSCKSTLAAQGCTPK